MKGGRRGQFSLAGNTISVHLTPLTAVSALAESLEIRVPLSINCKDSGQLDMGSCLALSHNVLGQRNHCRIVQ